MPEISSAFVEKNIPVNKFNRINITEDDGSIRELNSSEVKKFIKDLVFGGKKLSQLEKDLIKVGISGTSWIKRKKIMKLFEDLFDDKLEDNDREELLGEFQKFEEEENNK